jgi:thiol-disulfide isomerase/thioredoxin
MNPKAIYGRRRIRKRSVFLYSLSVLLLVNSLFASQSHASDSSLLEKPLLASLGFIVFDARERAPEILAPSASGPLFSLNHYWGQWVLLHFWATWCAGCLIEIPTLVRLEKHMKGRKFIILSLSVAMDRDPKNVRSFLVKTPVSYPVLLGRKGRVDTRYFGMGLPQTYLIDPRGNMVGKVVGPRDWSNPEAYHLFDVVVSEGR